ncbi:N-acetylglucosamine-6-phosphate deacetylase [Allofournierella sp.]|uniref:N-acetylglucosamine-6-phosphate deacetylase n=1 Tax=Allofournierella sp. TaxID=1940256 RepID=UPI002E77C607|nr:N-acetylglucosamine-6-phosphate deacetylase [Fournierella sp.]MEE0756432.1 N-acetylglucosamine-6-phosphate deacetylase [Fournierella sp.]
MIIKNGQVFNSNGRFIPADVELAGDRIVKVAPAGTLHGDEELDAAGKYVTPGFVDIHIHGAAGSDFCDGMDGSDKYVRAMQKYLGSQGVTSFLGTTMAFSEEILDRIFDTARPIFGQEGYGAVLRGVNMEGPFFNKAKKGAQAEEYIIDPDWEMFQRLWERSGHNIRLVDVAPELPGALEFAQKASKLCTVSIAHTCATYEEATAAFANGFTHTTHLFNAMPAFTHRAPGVVGAASDFAEHIEMICDGIHLNPAVVRAVFNMFGPDRVCIISDAMQACGMPNGEYSLGGQKVFMTDGLATLADGTIAGSATCQAEGFRRAVKFGVPLESALKAATINPARAAGLDDEVGSIAVGKRADVLVLGADLHPEHIFIGGKEL